MAPIHSQVGSSLSKQTANAPKIAHSSRPLPARRRQAAAVTASAAPQQQNPAPTTRRALIIESAAASAAALLAAAAPALAEDAVEAVPAAAPAAAAAGGAQRAYLDVRLEGQPLGRLTVELLPEAAPVGARRFADLAVGRQGVGYRLARFDRVTQSYVRCEGVASLSYAADGESPIAGGDSTADLEKEMDATALRHNEAGLVSLVVRAERPPEVTERLVAIRGKLVTVQNVVGEAPNGTAFAITTGPAPELDATNLVVGRVVGGADVLAALSALPRSKPRDEWFDKPFFEVGKAIGDKRATVAEKGFNRPLKRAIVASAGLL